MTPRLRVLRGEAGVGLIELLIALTVLAVGIAGTLALFGGSILSLQHASKEGTAVTLADRQLETYRSMPFSCIPASFPATAPSGCGTYSGFPNPYSTSQTTSASESPDHRTYVVTTTVSSATGSTYQIKVTVAQSGSSTILATETSYFSSAGSSG